MPEGIAAGASAALGQMSAGGGLRSVVVTAFKSAEMIGLYQAGEANG
jgi:hypothetical protein